MAMGNAAVTVANESSAATGLLILGDSIARGYGLENPAEDCYGAKLAVELGWAGYSNFAVDGATSGDLTALLKQPDAKAVIAPHNTVVISIGGNDLLGIFFALAKQAMGLPPAASNLELQAAIAANPNAVTLIGIALLLNQAQLYAAIDGFSQNLTEIVTSVKTANPDALYIQTIYNPFSGVPDMATFNMAADAIITQMNAAIINGAESGGYVVADIYEAFKDNALLYTNIADFDIHPNAAGHELIFEILYEMITGTNSEIPAEPATAYPSSHKVLVNGKNIAFDAYTINDSNYFKLRDLAFILSGTEKQFDVKWDGEKQAILLTSGEPYTVAGGEMTGKGEGNKTANPTKAKIYLDGKEIKLTAYNILDNNYFMLRDIGQAFDFGVDWDNATRTVIIDTSIGYTLPE